MIWKTHLAISIAAALCLFAHVTNPALFLAITLASGFFPDIDSRFSRIGRKKILRPVQWTFDHRGVIHSYTLCVLLSLALAFVFPIAALPFFLGYSLHLFADSFTPQGIKPFWPLKAVSKGVVTTGGKFEKMIFYSFVVIDLILIGTILYTSV